MARGELNLYTASGWITIDLGDPADLSYTPVEIRTPNGWAAPRVVDPADADSPLELYTASGWKGIARRLRQTIDSFEDNDLSEWEQHDGDFTTLHAGNAGRDEPAKHGDYICKFGGDIGVGNNDGISSTSGLPRYPSRGDTTGVFVNPNDLHDAYYHVGVQETRNKFPHSYSARANGDGGGSPTFELWYEDPSEGVSDVLASTSFDTTDWQNSNSEIRIDWGDPTITATCLDSNGTVRAQVSADDTRLDSGGVGIGGVSQTQSSTHTSVWFDWLYLTA